MSRNDTIYTLQQDIEIPKIVTDKANKILEQIRKDADMKNNKMITYQKPERKCRKRYMVIALAATLAVGTATAYAAHQMIISVCMSKGM